jgi:hypothetical protein
MQLGSGINAGKALFAFPVASQFIPSCFYVFGGQDGHLFLRNGDKESPTLFEPNRERGRFDFDSALTHADIERHSGTYSRFSPDILRNNKSSGRIYGTFHTIENTITYGCAP